MHVVLDLRMVERPLHGIARYALELSRRLPALAPHDHFSLLVRGGFDASVLGPPRDNLSLVTAHSAFLSVQEQAELPVLLRKLGPDLYHSPSFSVPAAWRGPLALTLHDANHLAFPEHYGRFHGLYYRHLVRPGAMRAKLVLTVSRFARGELEHRLALPADRIRVVYNGVDGVFHPQPPEAVEAFRRRLGLPDRFVLYVGNTKRHKNVVQLLDAFARLRSDLWLVLCAGPKAHSLVHRAGAAADRVVVLDDLDDPDLPLLYASANIFAFPSLYEGFGLPPLEAMAVGTPVVATRASAMVEVLEEAASFVAPGDSEELAHAIERVDAEPGWAGKLRARGLERAARFSWDLTARTILDAYRGAVQPRSLRVPGPRGASSKVLFCVRQNLWSLPGGDATQILRTRAALEERGVQVTLWTEPRAPATGSYDIAHLFHLTRLDTYVQARALVAEGMPFVLSTIYWPTTELEKRGYVGVLKLLHRTASGSPAEAAKNAVRAILADGDWRWALLPEALLPLEGRIEFLVRHARSMLPNSQAEGEVLRGFGARRIDPIVNASDPPPEHAQPPPGTLPGRYVLCAGRIEPRKNQLALVEALQGTGVPLLLVGDPGPMHGDYFRRLQHAAVRDVSFLPAQKREQLFALYSAAEAHVAPAWYETPGLVSLEAAAAGTRVVTTDRGSTREYFLDQASYLDPGDKSSIREAVLRSLAAPKDAGLRDRVLREFTWQRAAEQTQEAYRAALSADALEGAA